jgi:dihydrofolate reductase
MGAQLNQIALGVNQTTGMRMARVRVESFTISLDGYGAGPNQDVENPLGVGGADLHQWAFPTRTFQRALLGADDGTTGTDDTFAARGFENVGAWILGRNMFGPVRGPWPDMTWKGWWRDNPPYHVPVFVLTHHERPPIRMEGDTTFHFVTGGIHEALDRARKAAKGMDVRIGGGPNTIQQYLRAGLIDELHIAVAPVLLGRGELLFDDVDLRDLGYACVEFVGTEKATHVVLRRKD